MYDYIHDGAEIYRQSFATIRSEARLDGLDPETEKVVVRMIHACGQVDLVDDVRITDDAVTRGRAALQAGAPILCDATMVASGVTRRRLPVDNDVICLLGDPRTPELAVELETTRTAAAVRVVWSSRARSGVRGSPRRHTTSLSTGSRRRVTPEATIVASHRMGAPACSAARARVTASGVIRTSSTRSTWPHAWIMRTTTFSVSASYPSSRDSRRMVANDCR